MSFKPFMIGRVRLRPGHPLIAGVLNVTPDSFSDGGKHATKVAAVRAALRLEGEGADMLDIGGESTRPGAEPVTEKDELKRVIPVIEGIRKKSDIPISIDTAKPAVARAAVQAGADAVNDVTGFRHAAMIEAAAELKTPVIAMHMKGTPRTMQKNPRYKDVVMEVRDYLKKQADMLHKAGVKHVVIDPGIGFGKAVKHNLQLLNGVDRLTGLGYPVMVGASRKSFIGKITGAEVDDRLPGTLAAHLFSVMAGAAIIRAHDVAAHRQALDIALKIAGS